MTVREWLLSTVLSAGVCMAAGHAYASQSTQILQPDGGWSVSRIAAAQGGDAYCAMARKYDRDIILTIARNGRDETSVAIDFQKEGLNKDRSYNVTLHPGAGQERSYDVRPVSGKAVVLRLGKDKAFHDALGRSASLGVDIGGESYAFNMPDIGRGQGDVVGCLATMMEPAAGEEEEKPKQQQVSASVGEAEPSVSLAPIPVAADVSSSREAEALREENLRLRNALERERRDFENRFMQQDGASSMTAELSEKIRLMEIENSELKYQLSNVPVLAPASAQTCPAPDTRATEAMASELILLRDENTKLRGAADASPEMAKELTGLRDENTKLRGDVEALNLKLAELDSKAAEALAGTESKKQEVDAQSIATIGRLQGRIEVLEAESAGLKESLRMAQDQVAAAAAKPQDTVITLSQLRSVEEQLKLAEAERDRLRGQIENVRSGREETVIGSIAGNNWDLEQATRRFNEAEREIRRLGAQVEQQRAQCSAEKKEIEYMLFDPEIATQEQIAKLTALEQELAKAKAQAENGSTGYMQKISDLQAQIALKDAELSAMRSRTVVQPVSARVPGAYTTAPLRPQPVRYDESHKQELNERAYEVSKPVTMPVLREASASEAAVVAKVSPAAGGGPVFDREVRAIAPAAVMPAPVKDVSLGGGKAVSSEGDISSLLAEAGIEAKGGIRRVSDSSADGFDAYSWETKDGLFGSAEVHVMAAGETFDDLVTRYLSRTQGRCKGEFASVPVVDVGQAGGASPVKAFEVACLGEDTGASASIVFFTRGGQFITVAHEAPVDGMDLAMDARDHIIVAVQQNKLASN